MDLLTNHVGSGEAAEVVRTGYVPNTARAGDPKAVFFTADEPLTSASEAKSVYGLEDLPTHRVGINTSKITNTYGSAWGNNDDVVTEVTTKGRIPMINIQKLGE